MSLAAEGDGAPTAQTRQIVTDIVRQHAEQAAFFWAQRDTLMLEDPPDVNAVAGIDRRLEANLDGLRVAGAAAWPIIARAYEDFPEKGELFLFTWMAIGQSESNMIARAVEYGRASEDDARGLVGALAWHKAETIGPLVREWIGAPDGFKRYLGIAACVEHCVDPKQLLARLIGDPDVRVRAHALRLAGRLKRADLVRDIACRLEDTDEQPRLWAAWALTELGSGDLAGAELKKAAVSAGPHALSALRAIVKIGPDRDVRAWMGGLLKSPDTAPLAVRGAGMLGDRTILHWLVHQMRNPALAVAAGGALLELFPEARDADLFTLDAAELSEAFEEYFGDFGPRVPAADRVMAWGTTAALLGEPQH